jgi:hypothetical protein
MPSKKKIETEETLVSQALDDVIEKIETVEEKPEKIEEKVEKSIKYPVGSIVFVSKDADADLNGFKLFPPYKKYTYTVEAYDENTEVYSLRRLNLSLRLKEADIVAPNEKGNDKIKRIQF